MLSRFDLELEVFYRRFIISFFVAKLSLIACAFLLGETYAYGDSGDVVSIISPSFFISLPIFLKYLSDTRKAGAVEKDKQSLIVSKSELFIVFTMLFIYTFSVFIQLFSFDVGDVVFLGLKSKLAYIESFFGIVLGRMMLDINNFTK